jgi:hypothetical protein
MFNKIASFLSKFKKSSKAFVEIVVKVPDNHLLVILVKILDWQALIEIAKARRATVLKMPHVGRRPHLREMLGILILRTIKSCTLQEAMDLASHYGPARIFCGFIDDNGNDSGRRPDYRTISDFEILMGEEVLKQINAVILQAAADLGFADIKGLCSDTTAQEAAIPYPTEVGLMRSFARSIINGTKKLLGIPSEKKAAIKEIVEKIAQKVRKYRLFAKTSEDKRKIGKEILKLVSKLHVLSGHISSAIENGTIKVTKKSRRFANRLPSLLAIFLNLMPQIKYFLKNGKPCKNKIISLDMPEVRSIPRGKDGKDCEFGVKWIVSRIRNGYIWLTADPSLGNINDPDCAVKAVEDHIALFGAAPVEFGYDRGGWSEEHVEKIQKLGVKRAAVAPKGKAKWRVSNRCKTKIMKERAQVEGSIGCLKRIGFNRPYSKNTTSLLRAGQRAALRLNLIKLVRDIKTAP